MIMGNDYSCRCCGKGTITPETLAALEKLEAAYEKPLKVTSAYRCRKHNARVGGKEFSAHLFGLAVDVAVPWRQAQFCAMAKACGFTVAIPYAEKGFCHLALASSRECKKRFGKITETVIG